MIDKIRELLGEELSKQVTEKLGTVELAVMNDGTVVKAEKYDTLKADNKLLETKYQTDISEFNKKLGEATKGTEDIATLKTSLETFKADNETLMEKYKTDTINIKLDSAIDVALIKANADEKYLPLLKPQINKDNLKIEDGKIIGLTDSIDGLLTNFPKMFGEVKKTGVQPPSGHKTVDTSKRAQLIAEFDKTKDPRARMRLQSQISQLNKE